MSGSDETVSSLSLSANSIIDMSGGDSILTVTGNMDLNGFTLSVYNYNGSYFNPGAGNDQLIVNGVVNAGGGNIVFYTDNGVTPWAASYIHGSAANASEVVPAPEPGAWISAAGIFVIMVWHSNSRVQTRSIMRNLNIKAFYGIIGTINPLRYFVLTGTALLRSKRRKLNDSILNE